MGEDVSELLDMIAAQLKVVEVARIKKSCRRCEKMVQVPAPSRPIPGSMAGPGLLAYVLVSKFDDHLPLYRLNEIFARMGADIPDSTLVDWCGRAMKVLQPLIERVEPEIMASDLLHCDDTPIRVLDRSRRGKGLGKGGGYENQTIEKQLNKKCGFKLNGRYARPFPDDLPSFPQTDVDEFGDDSITKYDVNRFTGNKDVFSLALCMQGRTVAGLTASMPDDRRHVERDQRRALGAAKTLERLDAEAFLE